VPVACGWSDVGSWHAVWELSNKDEQGNAARGAAVFEDSRNCNVSTDRALVALEGVDDLVVVATQDAVLVSRQKDANGLKRLVAKLKTVAPQVTEEHLKVHRPWGSYQSVDMGERHQVKRIIVKPGGRLSLQKHHHRSEHWIVVRGAARVTVNELVKTVHENESIYIPIGAVHRLENPGKIQLELIEVQTGSYFGEDDIIRIEDDYQRTCAIGTMSLNPCGLLPARKQGPLRCLRGRCNFLTQNVSGIGSGYSPHLWRHARTTTGMFALN